MKATTKLWIIGIAAGVLALGVLLLATGYAIGDGSPSTAGLVLLTAVVQCLGFLSTGSCLAAVVVGVLQEDQRAGTILREAERRLGEPRVLHLKRDARPD